ncbi:MAG: hypothetical protein AABM33_15975 [Pseudomonadota bacterium]
MRSLVALLLAVVLGPALAQPGPGRPYGLNGGQRGGQPGHYVQREYQHPMPPPERRMSWEERQRLREQVHNGNMTRDEARERWREQRERRGIDPARFEQRERLRRDVQEANRDLERR